MKNRIHYLIYSLVILIIGILILFGFDFGLRGYLGDLLVVMFIYLMGRFVFNSNKFYLALSVLGFAFIIEFIQILNIFDPNNFFYQIILGATFYFWDLVIYFLGIIIIYLIDLKIIDKSY